MMMFLLGFGASWEDPKGHQAGDGNMVSAYAKHIADVATFQSPEKWNPTNKEKRPTSENKPLSPKHLRKEISKFFGLYRIKGPISKDEKIAQRLHLLFDEFRH